MNCFPSSYLFCPHGIKSDIILFLSFIVFDIHNLTSSRFIYIHCSQSELLKSFINMAAPALQSNIELSFRGKNMPKSLLSSCDPFLAIFEEKPTDQKPLLLAITECIENSVNPTWKTTLSLEFYFEKVCRSNKLPTDFETFVRVLIFDFSSHIYTIIFYL